MKMNNQNMHYPNYYSNYNNYYNQMYRQNPYTAFYHPYTENLPNDINIYNSAEIKNNNYTENTKEEPNNINIQSHEEKLDNSKSDKDGFRFGPLDVSKNRLSIFGFSIELDDLILIALIIFLFFETDCDYSILIVLSLMLFNISFSSLDFL